MTEPSEPLYYSIHTEAEQFVKEWPDQWDLDEQKAQSITLTIFEGKEKRVDNLLSLFLGAITAYKIALSNAAMHTKLTSHRLELDKKHPSSFSSIDIVGTTARITELNNAGSMLIDIKNRLQGVKALQRIPSPYKRIQELENELKQQKESEEKINQTLASVNLAYTRLKKRIIHEMGEKLGHKYIQDAITDSNDNVWEGEVVDGSEDDKRE